VLTTVRRVGRVQVGDPAIAFWLTSAVMQGVRQPDGEVSCATLIHLPRVAVEADRERLEQQQLLAEVS